MIETPPGPAGTTSSNGAPIQSPPFTSVPPVRSVGMTGTELAALALSLVWLALVAWFFLGIDPEQARITRNDPLGFMMTIVGVLLPVALAWVAASAARTARTMREESARLQAAIDAMRLTYVESQQTGATSQGTRSIEAKLDEVARRQAAMSAEISGLGRSAVPSPPAAALEVPRRPNALSASQPTLALDTDPDHQDPLPTEDFIRAVDFPRNDRDREGFAILRKALEHRQTAQLIQAAQDVLTLLSQDGIYMDDLSPNLAPPTLWRAFADGVRGPEIAAIGGIRDRSALALAGARMREDTVFRDAVHHFLRAFDRALANFVPEASDAEVGALSDTRSARAFMVLGRISGLFD